MHECEGASGQVRFLEDEEGLRGPGCFQSARSWGRSGPLPLLHVAGSFLLGQGLSLLVTGTGVFSTILADSGVSIPTTQSSLNYVLLTSCLWAAAPSMKANGLTAPFWRYFLWALVDVEANCFVVLAYRNTSIASVMLLDCFAIPSCMLVARGIGLSEYLCSHLAACLICVVGLALTVASDIGGDVSTPNQGEKRWLGDVLVLLGSALYGFSNVQQELLLKRGCSRFEALGMLGLCGSLISIFQAAVTELTTIAEIHWTLADLLCILGFQMCLFGFYLLTSVLLSKSDAAFFNISLLTSDFYSVAYACVMQQKRVTWMYGLAFSTTVAGLVLYYCLPPPLPADFAGATQRV